MILEKSTGYWSIGIVVRHDARINGWCGSVEYFDDGFVGDDNADTGAVCTEGKLTTRYFVRDGEQASGLTAVIDVLIADAGRLGITFRRAGGMPAALLYPGDGEDSNWPPPAGYRELLRAQAERIGWATYGYEPTDGAE